MTTFEIGRSPDNPVSAEIGGILLGNELVRTHVKGSFDSLAELAVTVAFKTSPSILAATLSGLAITASTALMAGGKSREEALALLDSLDLRAKFVEVLGEDGEAS